MLFLVYNGMNSNKNTARQVSAATTGSLNPFRERAIATTKATRADQTVLVEYKIAGNVITDKVTYGT